LVGNMGTPDRRCYVATLEAADSLRARERELVHECERLLAEALLEAWTAEDAVDAPADPHTAAPITAAVWLAAGRVMILEQRPHISAGVEPEHAAVATQLFADRLLAQMETCLQMISGVGEPLPRAVGRTAAAVRRAG
jgi:hypothetical protein